MTIDLNCDMGELPESIANGGQEAIMPYLSSVNVACGGHAGDDAMMAATVDQATRWHLGIGAHPGYPDRANFGRLPMPMSSDDIARTVYDQIRQLAAIAAAKGASLRHVKPHGALYNEAAKDAGIAQAIAEGVSRWSRDVVLVGLAGSLMLDVFREAGFKVAPEAFADRRYEPDGSLRARRFADSMITDPEAAAQQVLEIVESGHITAIGGVRIEVAASTICIHGDTSGALEIASAVALTLREHGIELLSL